MKFLLPLVFSSLLYAAPEPDAGAVSSANAVYDGNSLVLTGHVLLDHSLGKMAADEAILQRQENNKDFPFSLIQLFQNVQLDLKAGAQIQCTGAELDFINLKGFLSSQDGGRVLYSDKMKKGVLRILGSVVELKIAKISDEQKGDFEIETILAKDAVDIEFGQGYLLQADRALYRKTNAEKFQGVITAYPKNAETPCRLTHENDLIFAESADLDLVHAKLILLRPKGKLSSLVLGGVQKGDMQFSSDHLLWDQNKNILLLKGNVHILDSLIGTLTSSGELQIVQSVQKQKKVLKTLSTKGASSLIFKDEQGKSHSLRSHGPFHFDREKLRATIDSPKSGGKVIQGQQIYYETDDLAFYGNSALVEYVASKNHLRPTVLTLSGSIRLFSKDQSKPRYALADRMNLSTTTKTAILAADPGKKVLYVDDLQGVRISAQEIHITRDAKTGEERVQGLGNVQFAFSDEESARFQKVFSALDIK